MKFRITCGAVWIGARNAEAETRLRALAVVHREPPQPTPMRMSDVRTAMLIVVFDQVTITSNGIVIGLY
jgi:hypothetical protein